MPAIDLPSPGLGTYQHLTDAEQGPAVVEEAIELGYRHLDTAQKYDNEAYVGEGIARASVPREDLFVATKVDEARLAHDDVLRTTESSLERLGIDTIDLLYIHWPAVTSHEDRYDPTDTLPAFNALVDDGTVRHVGVANFTRELLEEARDLLDVPLLAHQVEMHPLLQQRELLADAREHDIYLVAYCPMLRGQLDEVPELADIAERYDATPGQVSLAWLMSQDNVVPIPGTGGSHLAENLRARDITLSQEDLEAIDAIDRELRVVDSPKGPWNW